MGDEEDGDAVALEDREDLEQTVRLLRREHPGRLVEDQDARAPEKGLEDLDPLLETDRQLSDQRIGIDVEPVGGAQVGQPGSRRLLSLGEQGAAFAPEHHVLEHGHRGDQHEVLVHHADAVLDGIR